MNDNFFTTEHCDRCNVSLNGEGNCRVMSWFTEETICMKCSDKERAIKKALREMGLSDMEGCGFIPDLEQIKKEQGIK